MGFMINPHDPYVANEMVNWSQLTVIWHVGDLRVSHKNTKEVTESVLDSEKIYGDDGFTVKRGKVHSYLGMDFGYSTDGKLKVESVKVKIC